MGRSVTVPITYDYLISNDNPSGAGSWSAALTSLQALGAGMAGKVVAITNPATYSAQTLTLTGGGAGSAVLFAALYPNLAQPIVRTLTLSSTTSNLKFQNVEFLYDLWTTGIVAQGGSRYCCGWVNTNTGTYTFDRCTMRGCYRTDPSTPFDPNISTYPEYANIWVSAVTSGAITALSIIHANVGDLTADGTYNLSFSVGTGATATMTVVGSQIVSTNVTAGGSGYTLSSASATPTQVTWASAGQVRMVDGLAYGAQNFGTLTGSVAFTDCSYYLLNNGIKVTPSGANSTFTATGNTLDVIYQDAVSLIGTNTILLPAMTVSWNFVSRGFSADGDPGAPHSDSFQLGNSNFSLSKNTSLVCEGNVWMKGVARGTKQGPFWSDVATASAFGWTGRFCGNLVLSALDSNQFLINSPAEFYAYGNLLVRYQWNDSANAAAATTFVPTNVISEMMFGNNVVEVMNLANGNLSKLDTTTQANLLLTRQGTQGPNPIAYSAVFADPLSLPTTIAAAATAFTTIGAYAGYGPQANGYTTYATRTIDVTQEPTWWLRFDDVPYAAKSSTINSVARRILGGPATGTWSCTGSGFTVQFADDAAFTVNVTSPSSAGGTYTRDKYVRMNVATGSGGTVTASGTLTLRSTTQSWNVTTVSTASFDTVDTNNAAWSNTAAGPDSTTGIDRMVYAWEALVDTATTSDCLNSNTGGNSRVTIASGGHWKLNQISGAFLSATINATISTSAYERHILIIDYSQTTLAAMINWYKDGVLQTFTTLSGPASGPTSISMATLFGTNWRFFNDSVGTGILDGKMHFFYLDYGKSSLGYTLPSQSDPLALNNLFSADNINLTDGSGPQGHVPKMFYTGDATAWNAGIANKGTLSATLTKQAGTYI